MSNYTPVNDFSVKDALTSGDPEKIILGSDMDNETAAIQTAVNSKYDTNTTTITLSGTMIAALFSGSGASLTSLPAANVTGSHALPDSVLSTNVPLLNANQTFTGNNTITAGTNSFTGTLAGNGSGITSLTAANVAGSHTLPDGVLSTNVPLLNAANVFTATDQKVSASNPRVTLNDTSAANVAALRFESNGTLKGFIGLSNKTGGLVTGDATGEMSIRVETNKLNISLDGGTTKHLTLDSTGLVTTPNASAAEVGFKGLPQNSQSNSYTCVLTDANKTIYQTGASKTFTIPANGTAAFPIGTVLNFVDGNGSGQSIAIATDAMFLAGTAFGTSGTRTLAPGGIASALKITSTQWLISGNVS